MANQKISQLNPAAALTGSELMEAVQGGVNVKTTVDALRQRSITKYATSAPAAGTYPDIALADAYDYVLDYDTTAGLIEIDGVVAQRDGQEVTFCCTGANPLRIGANLGTLANQVRMNSSIDILQGDSLTIKYIATISRWIQK